MNAFYFKQRLSARVLAVLALFSLVASLLPMQAFAAGVYTIAGSGSVTGAAVALTGDSHANPQTGANNTQAMAVDWDEDMDGDPDTGTGFVQEVDFNPTFVGGNDSNADGFDDADWDATHTYTTSGTYNITVIVYHGNTSGNDGSDQSTFTYEAEVVVDPVNTKPVITLTGASTVNLTVGDTYSEAGASATDVEDGAIASTSIVIDSSAVNTSVAGTYSVTYNVDDSESLAADEVTRTVVVADAVPQMCTVTIVSDDTAFVVEKSANAIEITPNPAWTASIAGASWIWGDATVVDGTVNETQTFRNQFGFVGDVTSATLEVASDNTHSATVNASSPFVSVDDSTFDNASSYDVTSSINESGNNELNVAVTNLAAGTENPAGALYKLTIEGEVTTDDDCMVPYVDPATLGTLEVTKVIVGTTTVDESAFSFKLDGGATTTFETEGMNSLSVVEGTHDVVETAAPGYTTTSTCDDVVVTAGQTSTCTITNTVIVPTPPVCEMGSNLLLNNSFETPVADGTAFDGGFFELFDTVSNWVISNTEGTPMLELWNNLFGGASDGEQNAELDGNVSTKVSQTVATTPGATYQLRFDFSARPDTTLANNSILASVNGLSLITANGDGTGTTTTNWTTYQQTFVATTTSANISFADVGTSDGLGSLLDNAVLCMTAPAPNQGTLNVIKTVVGTTTVDESAFSFKVDGGATTTFETDGSNALTLTAGTYDVVENTAAGYTTSYNNCDNVVVTAGETSTCTITNTLNGSTPQVCTVNVYSDTSTTVNGSSTFGVGNEPGSWVDNILGSLAEWIWSAVDGSTISGDTDETDTFVKTFEWDGPVTSATLKLAADNMYSVTLNGTVVGSDASEDNYSSVDTIIDISDNIVQGTNTLEISVTNDANGATTLDGNPAGLIYDLTVNGSTVDDCTPGGGGGGGGDVLSCSITATDTSIRRGRDVTLSYTSNDATSATINNGIGAVALSGSTLVENLRSDTTYTMTVSDGDDTATCSVFINTTSGGGGGGGSRNNDDDDDDGRVLGDSDSNDDDDDDDDDNGGSGSVLGEQVSAIPDGAPNAGAGGTSPLNLVVNTLPFVAFLRRK